MVISLPIYRKVWSSIRCMDTVLFLMLLYMKVWMSYPFSQTEEVLIIIIIMLKKFSAMNISCNEVNTFAVL